MDVADIESRTVDNPLTWSELEEIAEKCTTDSYAGTHIIMDHGEGLPYALEPMFISNGKDFVSEDGACATMLGGSWDVAILEGSASFDWGVTCYPVSDSTKKAVSPCGDWSAAGWQQKS